MSSYLCGSETINKIVNGIGEANRAGVTPDALKFDDPADFGVTLYGMNLNAVEQRYPDCIGNPDNLPGETDAEGHHKPYKYNYVAVGTVAEFADSLREYLYQCAEGSVSELPLFRSLDAFYNTLQSAIKSEQKKAQAELQIERNKTEYIGATETAKMIRARLASKFPGVKFSVKTEKYAGGASIDITWTDGPAADEVKKISNAFSGKSFDGMNDYANSNDAWMLPDGSVIFAECENYRGENYTAQKPHPEAKRVHFGADYIFENRSYSVEFAKPIIKAVCAEFGKPEPKYYEHTAGKIIILDWDSLDSAWGDLAHHINREIHDRLNGKQPEAQQPEPTAIREIAQANPDRIIICKPTPHTEAQQPEPVTKARTSSAPYGMKF